MELKQQIILYIKEKLANAKKLSKLYNEEKIEILADSMLSTGKSLLEIKILIDNKFSHEIRKMNHNSHLASLKDYYLSSIDKLKKNNNCYLLSYRDGIKNLEQANLKEEKVLNNDVKLVRLNRSSLAFKKESSLSNDYELIMADIAFLLDVNYATTYRIFDKDFKSVGVLNNPELKLDEVFLNLEEALQFVIEEDPKFVTKSLLLDYHDKWKKRGLTRTTNKTTLKENLEYVIKLFGSLPDIKEDNLAELKKDYLSLKILEILTNSLNNELINYGLIIDKKNLRYSYRLSSSYNSYLMMLRELDNDETICNNFVVSKRLLLEVILEQYYDDVKDMVTLILDNRTELKELVGRIIMEHLEYDLYIQYKNMIDSNLEMIVDSVTQKKLELRDTTEDNKHFLEVSSLFKERVKPLLDNYVSLDSVSVGNKNFKLVFVILLIITLIILVCALKL